MSARAERRLSSADARRACLLHAPCFALDFAPSIMPWSSIDTLLTSFPPAVVEVPWSASSPSSSWHARQHQHDTHEFIHALHLLLGDKLVKKNAEYLERVMLVLKPSEHSHILARKRDLLGLDRGFCLLVVVYLERTRFLSDNQPRKLEISELCTLRTMKHGSTKQKQ